MKTPAKAEKKAFIGGKVTYEGQLNKFIGGSDCPKRAKKGSCGACPVRRHELLGVVEHRVREIPCGGQPAALCQSLSVLDSSPRQQLMYKVFPVLLP